MKKASHAQVAHGLLPVSVSTRHALLAQVNAEHGGRSCERVRKRVLGEHPREQLHALGTGIIGALQRRRVGDDVQARIGSAKSH